MRAAAAGNRRGTAARRRAKGEQRHLGYKRCFLSIFENIIIIVNS